MEALAAHSPPPRPLVLALGDSLTAGHGLQRQASFVARLEQLLREHFPLAAVHDAGVSGNTAGDALLRLPIVLGSLRHRPDLVIVELGANDLLRGVPPAKTRSDLAAIVEELERCASQSCWRPSSRRRSWRALPRHIRRSIGRSPRDTACPRTRFSRRACSASPATCLPTGCIRTPQVSISPRATCCPQCLRSLALSEQQTFKARAAMRSAPRPRVRISRSLLPIGARNRFALFLRPLGSHR